MSFVPPEEGKSDNDVCDHCGKKPNFFCVDCQEYFCPQVAEIHRSGRKTSKHQLNELFTSLPVLTLEQPSVRQVYNWYNFVIIWDAVQLSKSLPSIELLLRELFSCAMFWMWNGVPQWTFSETTSTCRVSTQITTERMPLQSEGFRMWSWILLFFHWQEDARDQISSSKYRKIDHECLRKYTTIVEQTRSWVTSRVEDHWRGNDEAIGKTKKGDRSSTNGFEVTLFICSQVQISSDSNLSLSLLLGSDDAFSASLTQFPSLKRVLTQVYTTNSSVEKTIEEVNIECIVDLSAINGTCNSWYLIIYIQHWFHPLELCLKMKHLVQIVQQLDQPSLLLK